MDATRSRQHMTAFFAPLVERVRGSAASRLVVPVAPVAATIAAALVALVFIVMPTGVLEGMAVDSGVASLITAAEPPLGLTARFAIAFIAAIGVGGVVWFGCFLLVGARTVIVNRGHRADGVPVLRRADAHPDAPARRPVFANRDLGTPFLDVKADPEPMPIAVAMAFAPSAGEEHALPADLDIPMSSYIATIDQPLPPTEPEPLPMSPAAEPIAPPPIMAEPPAPEPTVAPTLDPVAAPRFAPHERIETFELTPMVRTPAPIDEPSTPLAPATIHDLLERLERGVHRRQVEAAPAPVVDEPAEPTLEDTLSVLRQLAARVG